MEEIDGVDATDNFAIGIAFGNSNSSIAFTSAVWALFVVVSFVWSLVLTNSRA